MDAPIITKERVSYVSGMTLLEESIRALQSVINICNETCSRSEFEEDDIYIIRNLLNVTLTSFFNTQEHFNSCWRWGCGDTHER